jgi:hypothetical protein
MASDVALSVAGRILQEIRAAIQGLALPAMPAANVVIQEVAATRARDLPAVQFPCILIAPHGPERVEPNRGTNQRDDVVYPVLVAAVAPGNRPQSAGFERHLRWRELLRARFHNQRLGSNLCHRVVVEPLARVEPGAWFDRNVVVSALVLHCHCREPRG